ncbi:hypothetical protein [Larkinella soli]|uniref:hypothetical protein n=1 Tax=Larkinella soli TaxID=1770527 RepID=UPI000FFC6741|nr:hypothetical protein [Larkinella soli]
MKKDEKPDQWEALFGKLRKVEPAEPKPFFYARVQARLARRSEPQQPVPAWWFRPAYAVAGLALLVLLNLAVAVGYQNPADSPAPAESETYDGFLTEYQLLQYNWDTADE